MPIANSSAAQVAVTTVTPTDTELATFNFVAGWILLITILVFVSKTRVGYVIIYYSLLMMILIILLTEYQQITPYLNNLQTIGQFDAGLNAGVGGEKNG